MDSRALEPYGLAFLDYIGEIRLQFEYRENVGARCGWLHVDAETMNVRAEKAGWHFKVILREDSSEYLGRLMINRAVY